MQQSLANLPIPAWNPWESGLVATESSLPSRDGGKMPSRVNILRHDRTRVEIELDLKQEGVLLLNDKYDPGWRVRVDGEKDQIFRCNYIMRGVHVPAGKHRVVFTYRPYLVPFLFAVAACLALVAWAVLRIVRSRSRCTLSAGDDKHNGGEKKE